MAELSVEDIMSALGGPQSNPSESNENEDFMGMTEAEFGNQIPNMKATTASQLRESRDNINNANTVESMNVELLGLTNQILETVGEDGNLVGFGPVENFFTNPGINDRNVLEKTILTARAAVNPEIGNNFADRNRLMADTFREAYGTLKGGGQITEYESKTVAASLSSISDTSLSEERHIRELNVIRNNLNKVVQRSALGIETDNFGREFKIGANGEREQVYTYLSGQELVVVPTQGQDIVVISDMLSKEQQMSIYNNLEDGQTFVIESNDADVPVSVAVKGQ